MFDPATNSIVDPLRLDESEVEALLRLAEHGLDLVVLPLEEAWRRHETAANRPSAEIAEGRFRGIALRPSSRPDRYGAAAAVRLRGTVVALATAGRSSGVTTAVT